MIMMIMMSMTTMIMMMFLLLYRFSNSRAFQKFQIFLDISSAFAKFQFHNRTIRIKQKKSSYGTQTRYTNFTFSPTLSLSLFLSRSLSPRLRFAFFFTSTLICFVLLCIPVTHTPHIKKITSTIHFSSVLFNTFEFISLSFFSLYVLIILNSKFYFTFHFVHCFVVCFNISCSVLCF